MKIPKQEIEHKKKCLLADDNALPAPSTPAPKTYPTPAPNPPNPSYEEATPKPSYDEPAPAPTPSYPVPAPAAAPVYVPAAPPVYPDPQPSYEKPTYQAPRGGRLIQGFGQRQPITNTNGRFQRRPKSSFRQQGRFQG